MAAEISVRTIFGEDVTLEEEFNEWAAFDPATTEGQERAMTAWRDDQIEEWRSHFPASPVQSMPDAVGLELERVGLGVSVGMWEAMSNEEQARMIAAARVERMIEFVGRAQREYQQISVKKPPKTVRGNR